MNKRRGLLATATSALAWPLLALAQAPERIRRVGLLSSFSPARSAPWHEAFRKALHRLGWVEGKNISIEYRYGEGRDDRLPGLARELVQMKVDLIVTSAGPDALAARSVTKTIPIVMAATSDAVAMGLVASLARPGGNVTGLSQIAVELAAKRLEMLKEIVPKLVRVAVLWNSTNPAAKPIWEELQLPARKLALQLQSLEIRSASDFDRAYEAAVKARSGALFILPDSVIGTNLKRVAELAVRNRLPSIYHALEFAEAGGMVTYGADRVDLFRRTATFVDKILRGAKPGDLPVEQPTTFELAINMKTVKALGIAIPPTIMVQATRVIE